MRTAEADILRGVLGRMAEEAPEPVSFEQLDTVVVGRRSQRGKPSLFKRPIPITVAAAVAVLLLAVGAILVTTTGRETIYLADGESLISTDPPIVQGAQSPKPTFNTSGFGDEVPLVPVTDTSKIVDTATTLQTGDVGEVVRITVLGETPDGVLALIVHAEGQGIDGEPMQQRCLTATLGGAQTCAGNRLEDVADLPAGLIPAEPRTGPSYTVGEVPADSVLTWEVPAETSVVTLMVNNETRWQRPVAQVAVFITDLVYGDRFELTAYDPQGNILDSESRQHRRP